MIFRESDKKVRCPSFFFFFEVSDIVTEIVLCILRSRKVGVRLNLKIQFQHIALK